MSSVSACELIELPPLVGQAAGIDWGVTVDAYLMEAARVGDRVTARVYCDLSGVISDGMTVATPELRIVRQKGDYTLVQSVTGRDHYVIVSELLERSVGGARHVIAPTHVWLSESSAGYPSEAPDPGA